jgi:signal transduction histidine kinase
MQRDVTARKQSEAKLERLNKELLEASRHAGMAEVATGVLHNVGNVLNSVNRASSCVANSLRKSKVGDLSRVVALLKEHEQDLGGFFANDSKARLVPGYLAQLADHLAAEQASSIQELAELQKNIEHIKEIVRMQQGLAKVGSAKESVHVAELVEDALRMNSSGLARHHVEVIREFNDIPPFLVEKHKVLQILINLVRNAKQACDALTLHERKLILRTSCNAGSVCIAVCDNGVGIQPENLSRIFSHGFTTKKNGHGFGLHSAAVSAKNMGGELRVHSDGLGRGATFTLELPLEA